MALTFERYVVILNSLIRNKTNYTLFTESREIVDYEFDQRDETEIFYIIVSTPIFMKYGEI